MTFRIPSYSNSTRRTFPLLLRKPYLGIYPSGHSHSPSQMRVRLGRIIVAGWSGLQKRLHIQLIYYALDLAY